PAISAFSSHSASAGASCRRKPNSGSKSPPIHIRPENFAATQYATSTPGTNLSTLPLPIAFTSNPKTASTSGNAQQQRRKTYPAKEKICMHSNGNGHGNALLVVDAQQSFRHRPYWCNDDVPAFIERTQSLIDRAKSHKIPVAQIFHVEDCGAFSLD